MKPYAVSPIYVPAWIKKAVEELRPRPRLPVSRWAEANRVLPPGSPIPGPWQNQVTPYLTEIMDAFSDGDAEKIIFVKPTQVGGTAALENMLGSLICQEPAPVMVVYPTDTLVERTVESKLEPMIKSTPALAEKYLEHESTSQRLKFRGMTVYLSGANSPASLSSTPTRYLFLDEVDKYPGASKKEADPLNLAIERTKTYTTNRKIFMTSTPTVKSGRIWREKEAADCERHYFVPCPHCGKLIELVMTQLKWPKKEECPDNRDRAARAVYICQECAGVITDRDKGPMLQAGRWQTVRGRSKGARSVAYWISTLYSPFTRFSEIAMEKMLTKGDPERAQNFANSWGAEPWEQAAVKTTADLVLARRTDVPEFVLPEWTQLLTGGVDVQEGSFYWAIRAWGAGMTSQNVAHGQTLTFTEISRIMNLPYAKENGERMLVNLALVDSGDQTDTVYELCYQNSDWALACKGVQPMRGNSFQISTINKTGSRASGMQLVLVDGAKYKDMIAARMKRDNGPGAWMVHKDCDREYAEQVTAEEKTVTLSADGKPAAKWMLKSSHAANHYLDAEVYAAAAADILNVRSLGLEALREGTEPPAAPPKQEEPPEEAWIRKNEDWI
jgi:phage terminase large subunit GpA-like protein